MCKYVGTYTATTEIVNWSTCMQHTCMYVSKCTLICTVSRRQSPLHPHSEEPEPIISGWSDKKLSHSSSRVSPHAQEEESSYVESFKICFYLVISVNRNTVPPSCIYVGVKRIRVNQGSSFAILGR